MRSKAIDSLLEVKDISLKIGDKDILQNLSATAQSGDILAIMGPTGSGKTTLLNVISGRQKADSGMVNYNGQEFGKRLRRRLAFVQQQDVFFSHLTLWETLYFTAQIRLPDTMTEVEKKKTIDDIVDSLDIRKCLNTVIGDRFVRGLSGGEKKRASIACELLVDPDIMLLDEPTSGLDSSTAFSLMVQLKTYSSQFNKTIITTIHQPSSQIYHMFNKLLLLVDGQEAYWGPANEALDYFSKLNLTCSPHFNPADFLLEIVKSDKEIVDRIVNTAKMKREENAEGHSDLPLMNSRSASPTADAAPDGDTKVLLEDGDVNIALISNNSNKSKENVAMEIEERGRWSTSWFTQYKMLSWRSFKQAKGVLMQGYAVAQAIIVSVFAGIIYFQIDKNLGTIRDTMGLIFFCNAYWTFQPAIELINSFPAEKPVISKERASGAYRLSTYYAAKMTSDLPLTFILPIIMYVLFYSMAGLGGVVEFFPTCAILLLQVLVAQALGFVVGAACADLRMALTTMVCYMISSFLVGGFFTQNIPDWITWAKYLSIMLYPFSSDCIILFDSMEPTPCNATNVIDYPVCLNNGTTHVYPSDILNKMGITLPIHCYIVSSVLAVIVLRIVGYFVLRYRKAVPL